MAPKAAKESKEKNRNAEGGYSGWAEFVHKFKQNPFIFIGTLVILFLTIVAFVLVPAISPSTGGAGKMSFGSYDGKPIDFVPGNYFADQRDYYNEQFRTSGQNQNIQTVAFQVWRAAFESTVVRTAALDEVAKAGFKTPEVLVDRKMAEYPAFQENGTFSAAKYKTMSDSDRMALRSRMREDIAADRYLSDLNGLRISTQEIEFIKKMASPERTFDFVSIPVLSYPDDEVASFMTTNPDLFKTMKLSRITLASSEADAKKVLESVQKGTLSFEDAARTHSSDNAADKGGDIGTKAAWELKSEIPEDTQRQSVLDLATGELSSVVKVPAGWAFYRCDEAALPSKNDAAALSSARGYMLRFERGRMEDWAVAKADAVIADAKTVGFEAAAGTAGLLKKSFGPVPLNYGDIEIFNGLSALQVAELQGASRNDAFLKAAFSTTVGSYTAPVVVGDNVIALRVTEERAADDRATAVVDFYYPYLVSQYDQQTIRNTVLESKKLKDNFYEVFIKNFLVQ